MMAASPSIRSREEPPGNLFVDVVGSAGGGGGDNDSHVSVSQQSRASQRSKASRASQRSTKSSQGRKLRQVLQKKQLDVLLQTYSSFLDEPDDAAAPGHGHANNTVHANSNNVNNAAVLKNSHSYTTKNNNSNDLYSIARKNSIEGNLNYNTNNNNNPIAKIASMVDQHQQQRQHQRSSTMNSSTDDYLRATSASPISSNNSWDMRNRMRNSKSLLQDDDDTMTHLETISVSQVDDTYNSDHAVVAPKRGGATNKREEAPTTDGGGGGGGGRKSRKKKSTSSAGNPGTARGKRNKKKIDFATRMAKAGEVIRGFVARATQKQCEIAEDFQQVTTELRHHCKGGANVVFEDIADHFDGIVENLFVSDNNNNGEQRDDDGNDIRSFSSSQDPRESRGGKYWEQDGSRHGNGRSSRFRPRTHEETIEVMSKQVSDMFEPLSNKVHDLEAACDAAGGTMDTETVVAASRYYD